MKKKKAPARAKRKKKLEKLPYPAHPAYIPTWPLKPAVAPPVQRETVMHYIARMLHAIFGEPLPDETVKVVAETVIATLPKPRGRKG